MSEPIFPTRHMSRRLMALLRAVEALPAGGRLIITRDSGGVRWQHPPRPLSHPPQPDPPQAEQAPPSPDPANT